MSAPAPDPPPNPTGTGDVKPTDAAAASSSSSPSTGQDTAANAEGGDVKMEETPKPEEIEDSLEDIPDHVRDVRPLVESHTAWESES